MITDWWPVLAILAVLLLGKILKTSMKLVVGGVVIVGALYLLTQYL